MSAQSASVAGSWSLPAWLALLLAVLVVFAIGAAALEGTAGQDGDQGILVWAVSAAVLGVFIVRRVPGNRFGWLLLGTGVFGALSGVSTIAAAEIGSTELTPLQSWVGEGFGAFSFFGFFWMTLGLIPLLFPTGLPSTRWWGLSGWVGSVALLSTLPLIFFAESYCTLSSNRTQQCLVWATNPHGISGMPHPEYSGIGDALFGLLLLCMLLGVTSLIVRMFRATGLERQQTKWLVAAVGFMVSLVVVESVSNLVFGTSTDIRGFVGAVLDVLPWVLIPTAIAIAILRYRLYDLGRIISRTVSYALLVLGLGLVFAGGVVWLPAALGFDDTVAVAGTTLGVAALFNPLRRRVQHWVDRRFNRSRYNAQRVMDAFAVSLRDRIDLNAVVNGWQGVVEETMQPERVGVWLR